jgi:hypothetical protein
MNGRYRYFGSGGQSLPNFCEAGTKTKAVPERAEATIGQLSMISFLYDLIAWRR